MTARHFYQVFALLKAEVGWLSISYLSLAVVDAFSVSADSGLGSGGFEGSLE